MNRIKLWVARNFFSDIMSSDNGSPQIHDATTREPVAGLVKRMGLRSGDISSEDFETPEFDLTQIYNGYNTDSYVRQGVDKYIDQLFKEGWDFYGKDINAVAYLKLRLAYMAEATGTPTGQLLVDIAEDVVKYANSIIVKARAKDAAVLPPGAKVTGLNGLMPVAGYFCLNVPSMTVKRDKNGTVKTWQQEVEGADKPVTFKGADVIHVYYKREKGNAFGTSFLIPVLDDVRALRQSEENVLKMMYRNIYPFYHVAVGEKEAPGTPNEVADLQDNINNMDIEGGIVTTNRVVIKPIASDQVINAEPYLKYLEERVFTGLGVPAIMFGRGNTANRSTGDNMTGEMADRIKAIQRTIELFINTYIVKELLMEGGYDPILNPESNVEFRFKENDLETKIKAETHTIYKYEHNAITEDEMRAEIGKDPITDRAKMFQTLITQANAALKSSQSGAPVGNKETNNKQKPTNQYGTKSSPKKVTNSSSTYKGLIVDIANQLSDELSDYINAQMKSNSLIEHSIVEKMTDNAELMLIEAINETIDESEDKYSISTKSLLSFEQIKTDIKHSLKDLKNYSEVNSLVEAVIDLNRDKLLEIF